LVAAVAGDRLGGRLYSQYRVMSLVVGLGYLGIGLIVFLTIRRGERTPSLRIFVCIGDEDPQRTSSGLARG
jgi:hypothetical protein